jgi:Transglycosylase associated protein
MESPPAFRRDQTELSASNHTRGFSGKSRALAVFFNSSYTTRARRDCLRFAAVSARMLSLGWSGEYGHLANDTDGFHPAGLLLSILGAIIVLWIWRMIKSRNTV